MLGPMDSDVVVTVLLLVGAAIHLPPVLGVLGVPAMERAYGTAIPGPDLAVLMRHRAVLFGLLSGLMAWAAFEEDFRWLAIGGGLISDVTFALLCLAHRDHGPQLSKLVRPDLLSIAALTAAGVVVLAG